MCEREKKKKRKKERMIDREIDREKGKKKGERERECVKYNCDIRSCWAIVMTHPVDIIYHYDICKY